MDSVRIILWLQGRRTTASLLFWLSALGYNGRDRSLANRLYFAYFAVFWLVWIFAVLALFGDTLNVVLAALHFLPPGESAALLIIIIFLAWFFWRAAGSARCSPFMFSEEDAVLICQTPVDRPAVAVVWMVGDWISTALPFAIVGISLRFASLEAAQVGTINFSDVFRYIKEAGQVLVVLLPLLLAVTFLLGAFGSIRLKKVPAFPLQPVAFIAIAAALGAQVLGFRNLGFPGLAQRLVSPEYYWIAYPFLGAFGLQPLIQTVVYVLMFLFATAALLIFLTRHLNLSLAAQETSLQSKKRTLGLFGFSDLVREADLQRRLPIQRSSRFTPRWTGAWIMIWKGLIQAARRLRVVDGFGWIVYAGFCMGVVLSPDIPSRLLAISVWVIAVGERATQQLRKDLRDWIPSGMLPFSIENLLASNLALPIVLLTGIGWTMLILFRPVWADALIISLLLLPTITAAALAGAYDLFRHSTTEGYLYGQVPTPGLGGVVIGILSVLTPLILFSWGSSLGLLLGVLLSFTSVGVIVWVLWKSATRAFRLLNRRIIPLQ